MASDETEWSHGERLLEDIGLRRDDPQVPSDRQALPVAPSDLDTAALRTLGGHTVICPMQDVTVAGGASDQHEVTSQAWILAATTIDMEDWQ